VAAVALAVRPQDFDGGSRKGWAVLFAIVILDVFRISILAVSPIVEIDR
jgi:hypothetical protein